MTVTITINGKKFNVRGNYTIAYRDIADLAGFRDSTPSMTMRDGSMGRIVHPGETLVPVHNMMFNVADTNNA